MQPMDPELQRQYREAQTVSERLVKTIEGYAQLVPLRANEAALLDEAAKSAAFMERAFRGWYERCRDTREALENPALRPTPRPTSSDDDPRSGT